MLEPLPLAFKLSSCAGASRRYLTQIGGFVQDRAAAVRQLGRAVTRKTRPIRLGFWPDPKTSLPQSARVRRTCQDASVLRHTEKLLQGKADREASLPDGVN
jgi:hypothetical protein